MSKNPSLLLIVACITAFGFSASFAVRPEMYFVKNQIPFKITSENGAVSFSDVQVKDVIADGNVTRIFALDKRKDDQGKSTFTYRLNFFSDSVNWCVDALNHLSIPEVYSSNFIVSLRSDSLIYPYAMKVGDTLRHASGSELMYAYSNERYVLVQKRKVVASESITVAGETLQAFRIEGIIIKGSVTDYGDFGKIPSETTCDFIEWFVPSKGVVKSEVKSKTGSTVTTMN